MQPDQYGLGRIPSPPDDRDKMFPFSRALPAQVGPLPSYKYWTHGAILNQGATPHCVGFSGAGLRASSPVRVKQVDQDGHDFYAECKKIDGIPNVDGSYVRVLAKVMQNEKKLSMYLWATSMDELTTWLLTKGPVVVGTTWYNDMFRLDAKGIARATGGIAGGHAYLIRGYNSKGKLFRCTNSWGSGWGQKGEFWMTTDDVSKVLFDDDGEAMTAVELA